MAEAGLPPHGSDATRPTNTAMSALAQLAQGRELGRSVGPLIQLLLDQGTPHLARSAAYDALIAGGLSDEDWHRVGMCLPGDIGRADPGVSARALQALAALPPHLLVEVLGAQGGRVAAQLGAVISAGAPLPAVAALDALARVSAQPALAAAGAASAPLTAALYEAWEAAAAALLGADGSVAAAAAVALADLLERGAEEVRSGGLGSSHVGGAAGPGGFLPDGAPPPILARMGSFRSAPDTPRSARSGGGTQPGGPPAPPGGVAPLGGFLAAVAFHVRPRLVRALPGILARARRLAPVPQASVPRLLAALALAAEMAEEEEAARAGAGSLTEPAASLALAPPRAGRVAQSVAALCVEWLASPHAAVVLAAAAALLRLEAESRAPPAAVAAAAPRAVAALLATLDSPARGSPGAAPATDGASSTPAGHADPAAPQVTSVALGFLARMPPLQQASLFGRAFPRLATLPRGDDRVRALVSLWASVLGHDWAAQHAGAGRGRKGAPPPPPQLQQLLADGRLKEWVAGAPGAAAPFREELVAALLYVLLTHDRVAGGFADARADKGAGGAVGEAAALQALLSAVEWLGAAVTALKGTKPCLGWGRMASAASPGASAVVDLWLQLLLAALRVAAGVERALAVREPPPPAAGQTAAGQPGGDAAGAVQTGPQALVGLHRRTAALAQDVQGLLLQIASNWRALNAPVQARAVWICAFHLQLQSALDASWTSLVDAVHGLLSDAHSQDSAGHLAAVREGTLSAKVGAQRDVSVAGQNVEVALLCLEHLAALLVDNHKDELVGQLAPVASLLEKLVGLELEACGSRIPGLRARLGRVRAALLPVATSGRKKAAAEAGGGGERALGRLGAPVETSAGPDGAPAAAPAQPSVVALRPAPGQVESAAYPVSLPANGALFHTAPARRARGLLQALQAAVWRGDAPSAGGDDAASNGAGPPSLPALADLLDVLGGGDVDSSTRGGAPSALRPSCREREVTGGHSPLGLFVRVEPSPAARSLTVHVRAQNRTLDELRGVEVELALGGPLGGGALLAFPLKPLAPGGKTAWSATRTVSGFGWPVVAASIKLPLKVSLGSPVIRCCPLSISPLVLLNPPTHAVSPVQFYQRWQALPYGLSVQGSLQTPGPAGLSALFAAFAASGTLECVIKSVTPGHGVHAAFHGTSWDGDVVACLLTGLGAGIECSPAGAPILRFTIRSESQAVMDQLAGQEGELLEVLSGGLAVPVADDLALAGASVAPPAIVKTAAPATTPAAAPTQPESSTYSFLRGVTARTFAVEESEPAQAVDGAAALDLEPAAALALARRLDDAAVAAWRRLRETRRLQAAKA
ncbi:hypothetical protein ACKKBF_B00100 [Auxenochlorella protothecoides x Auxenochlorella symbiontica]